MSDEEQNIETEDSAHVDPESDLIRHIRSHFPDYIHEVSDAYGEEAIVISPDRQIEFMSFLRDDPALLFNYLSDLTAVDRLHLEETIRFAVVYQLYSYKFQRRIRIKIPVREDHLHIESVISIWPAANWLEREVYDMYGIVFDNHPDLRRLLMPDDFESYPLRKDYPLHGKGERDNFVS